MRVGGRPSVGVDGRRVALEDGGQRRRRRLGAVQHVARHRQLHHRLAAQPRRHLSLPTTTTTTTTTSTTTTSTTTSAQQNGAPSCKKLWLLFNSIRPDSIQFVGSRWNPEKERERERERNGDRDESEILKNPKKNRTRLDRRNIFFCFFGLLIEISSGR